MVDVIGFLQGLDKLTISIVFLTLVLTILLEKAVSKIISKWFLHKTHHEKKMVRQHHSMMKSFLKGFIYLLGVAFAIYAIPPLRAISVSIFASAGVLAVILGFAAQQAFSNIISGVFIVIFKPFRIGDRIKVKGDILGYVEDITLRHTIIRTFENKRFILPNSVIGNEVIENSNIGEEAICKFVEFGISYDSDIDKAMKIMEDEAMKHEFFIDRRTEQEISDGEPAVPVRIIGFGDSSVNLRAWVWSPNPKKAYRLGCDLNKSIKQRFDKEGIEIPFPYRTLVFKEKEKK